MTSASFAVWMTKNSLCYHAKLDIAKIVFLLAKNTFVDIHIDGIRSKLQKSLIQNFLSSFLSSEIRRLHNNECVTHCDRLEQNTMKARILRIENIILTYLAQAAKNAITRVFLAFFANFSVQCSKTVSIHK